MLIPPQQQQSPTIGGRAHTHTRNSQKQTQPKKKPERKKEAIAGSVPSTANELRSTNSCDDRISASISDGLGAGSSVRGREGGGLSRWRQSQTLITTPRSPDFFLPTVIILFRLLSCFFEKEEAKRGGKEDKTGAAAK